MGNEIFEQLNKEEYPEQVKGRVNHVIEMIKPYVCGRVADVACGNQYVGKYLEASEFYDYFVLPDSDINYIDLEKKVIQKPIKALIKNEAWIDTILLFHVLEHFKYPSGVLTFLSNQMLKPNGRFIIAVPVGDYNNKYKPFDKSIGHVHKFQQWDMFRGILLDGSLHIEFFRKVCHKWENEGFDEYVFVLRKS